MGGEETYRCPECAAEVPTGEVCPDCERDEDTPTQQLDGGPELVAQRYRLARRLGEGGMGEVWLAHDTRLDARVALKFIARKWVSDRDAVERFHREIVIARAARHPNVAAVYDLFDDGERVFFTMQYVPGRTLGEQLRQPLEIEEALRIAREICSGLAALHDSGIVHRDIKPRNIKVTPEGSAVILDLGVAKDLSRPDTTQPGIVVGTPDHMAPEQAAGREVTPATDIFAFGLVLYRMLTGVRLTAERSRGSGRDWVGIPAPSSYREQIPGWLDRVVLGCLDPDASRRYPDAGALLADLEEERRRTTQRTVTMTRGSLAGLTAGIVAMVALLAGFAALVWHRHREPPPLQARRLTAAAGLECGGALSPDGRMLVYAAAGEDGFDLFLSTVSQAGEPLRLTATVGSDELEPVLSHDGMRLAFAAVGEPAGIGVKPLAGGGVTWLAPSGWRPRWSLDDRRLLVHTGHAEPPTRDVLVVEVDADRPAVSLRERFQLEMAIHHADWEAENRILAVVGGSEIWRFDLDEGTSESVLTTKAALCHLVVDAEHARAAFLMAGADGWQPHLWHPRSVPRPVGGGGYAELTALHSGALLLTRAQPQMLVLEADLDNLGGPVRQLGGGAGVGHEQREYMPDLSPDGDLLAFISTRSGQPHVWIKNLDSGEMIRVSEGAGDYRWPSFGPDGGLLAYCSKAVGNGDILVYDMAAGTTLNLSRSPQYEGAPDWFPDGTALAINVKRDGQWDLARLSWPDGEQQLLTDDPEVDIDPAISPDAGTVAFNRDSRLHLLDLASGELTPLVPGSTPRWSKQGDSILFQAGGDLWLIPIPHNGGPARRLTHHPWPARHLEGVWKFALRGSRLVFSVQDYPGGDIVQLAPRS